MREIHSASAIVSCWKEHGIQGIVFDIDGTLLDSMGIWDDLGTRYLMSLGRKPEKNLNQILDPMTLPESTAYLKEKYQLKESTEEIRQGLHAIMASFYRNEVKCRDGVKNLLEEIRLQSIAMVLSTTGERDLAAAALKRNGIWSYFEHMFVCEDYAVSKREAKIYQIAAMWLGMEPSSVLVIEDLYQALSAAHHAGFRTAGVYDRASEKDKEKIMAVSDFCLPDFHTMEVRTEKKRPDQPASV